ncbi:hypothetical protein GH714_035669 [Hevea brasiliensis]|uniref:Uncharacterized protein n=1 Tax=Hevea brasiliensis TaxID=3981 RepID=A0A6A6KUU9_HEVBR|nr:hypothetical protein GH714_035669 [Hevea brasiliensis]
MVLGKLLCVTGYTNSSVDDVRITEGVAEGPRNAGSLVNLEDEAAFADAELEYSHRILAAAAYESWTPIYVKANNFLVMVAWSLKDSQNKERERVEDSEVEEIGNGISNIMNGRKGRVAKLRSKGSNGKENGGEPFVTDNGNYIVDLYVKRDIGGLKAASNAILRLAGVVEHGMFLDMANTVIVAGELGITIKNKHKQISNLFCQTARVSSSRRRHYIHLPLPSYTPESSLVVKESSVVYDVLEDIMEHIFVNLHSVEKNLQFWQSRAEVYMEVDRCGKELVKDPGKSFPSLLVTINGLFSNLEASIGHLHAIRRTNSSVDGSYSFPLLFERLAEVNREGFQWTECEIADAINLVNKNIQKLDSYLSLMVAKHQKPKKVTQYWICYACGAVGLSVCSMWLLRHSRLMGSPDIDNWICEAKDSAVTLFDI